MDFLLQEDGSLILLEDGSGALLLEEGPGPMPGSVRYMNLEMGALMHLQLGAAPRLDVPLEAAGVVHLVGEA